jgi:hypothetical protein
MAKLLYGGYGHHPSGKQYVYIGSDDNRTGQNLVAPVTNRRINKTYNTMFTVMRTGKLDGQMAQAEIERLESRGIDIKDIRNSNVLSLPGGKPFKSATQWKKYSNYVYSEKIKARLTGKEPRILTPEEYFKPTQKMGKEKKKPKVKDKPFYFRGVGYGRNLASKGVVRQSRMDAFSRIVNKWKVKTQKKTNKETNENKYRIVSPTEKWLKWADMIDKKERLLKY